MRQNKKMLYLSSNVTKPSPAQATAPLDHQNLTDFEKLDYLASTQDTSRVDPDSPTLGTLNSQSKQIRKTRRIVKLSQLKSRREETEADDTTIMPEVEEPIKTVEEKKETPIVIETSNVVETPKHAVEDEPEKKGCKLKGTPDSKDDSHMNFAKQTACVSDENQSNCTESSACSKSNENNKSEKMSLSQDTANIIESKLQQPYEIKRIWFDCHRKDILFELSLNGETDDNRLIISRRELATKNEALLLSFYEKHLQFSKMANIPGFNLKQPTVPKFTMT